MKITDLDSCLPKGKPAKTTETLEGGLANPATAGPAFGARNENAPKEVLRCQVDGETQGWVHVSELKRYTYCKPSI